MSDHVELENRNNWHVSHDKTAKLKLNLKDGVHFQKKSSRQNFYGGEGAGCLFKNILSLEK